MRICKPELAQQRFAVRATFRRCSQNYAGIVSNEVSLAVCRWIPAERAPKRSTRTRKLSSRVRVFDEHTRAEITRKKLDALEKDNWLEDKRKGEDDDDEEYDPLRDAGSDDEVAVDQPKKKKPKKAKKALSSHLAKKCKSLQEILDEAQFHKYPSWVPNYSSIAAAPSRYPPRRFCSVTGLAGRYKCPVTGDYLSSLSAYETHRETRLVGLI